MDKARIRISSLADGPHKGNNTVVEVKGKDAEWIDISSIVNQVDISLAVDGAVTVQMKVYPSAVALDVIADLDIDLDPQEDQVMYNFKGEKLPRTGFVGQADPRI